MNRTQAEECAAAALAVFEGYTQPDIDPEVIAEHNACAAAVVAALFDLHGQTQLGVRVGGEGQPVWQSSNELADYRASFWAERGVPVERLSRRVLPSVETEWEPAT